MTAFNHPTLVTLTAPTCSGKSYLLDELTRRQMFSRVISTTTRAPRPGEREGVDFYFIDDRTSKAMEANGEFFERAEFGGTRYGVTNAELLEKMTGSASPIAIFEPHGLRMAINNCASRGWDIFKIFVHTTESVRLERLLHRTLATAWAAVDGLTPAPGRHAPAFFEVASEAAKKSLAAAINTHSTRLLSITGDERHWQNRFNWDVIVPGDDVEKAIELIEQGIRWKNRLSATPQPF